MVCVRIAFKEAKAGKAREIKRLRDVLIDNKEAEKEVQSKRQRRKKGTESTNEIE